MNARRAWFTQTLHLEIGAIATTLATAACGLLLPRWLPPASYGAYALLLTFYAAVSMWSDGGAAHAAITRVSQSWAIRDDARVQQEVAGLTVWLLGTGGFLLLMGSMAAPWFTERFYHDRTLGVMARPLFALGFAGVIYQVAGVVLQSTQQTVALAGLETCAAWIRTFLVLVAAVLGWGVHGIVGVLIVASVVASGMAWWVYAHARRCEPRLPSLTALPRWSWRALRQTLALGLRVTVDKRLYALTELLPVLIAGAVLSRSAVADVQLALALITAPLVLLGPMSRTLTVHLAGLAAQGNAAALRRVFVQTAGLGLALSAALTGLLLVTAPWLLAFYGGAYASVPSLLPPLALYYGAIGLGIGLGPLFRAQGRLGWTTALNAATVLLLIVCGPAVLRSVGLQGFLLGYAVLQLTRSLILCVVATRGLATRAPSTASLVSQPA